MQIDEQMYLFAFQFKLLMYDVYVSRSSLRIFLTLKTLYENFVLKVFVASSITYAVGLIKIK